MPAAFRPDPPENNNEPVEREQLIPPFEIAAVILACVKFAQVGAEIITVGAVKYPLPPNVNEIWDIVPLEPTVYVPLAPEPLSLLTNVKLPVDNGGYPLPPLNNVRAVTALLNSTLEIAVDKVMSHPVNNRWLLNKGPE